MHKIEIKIQDISIYRLAFVCMSVVCLFALTAAAFAATDPTDANDAYVDSVYSWGIWELDLEPASGPEVPASNAINDRSRKLLFRPNDNAAFVNPSIPVATPTPPLLPPTPVVGASGSGPILPGMVPNQPNLR